MTARSALKIEKTLSLISEVVTSPYGKQLRVFIIVVSSPYLKISRYSVEYPERRGRKEDGVERGERLTSKYLA